MVDQSVTPLTGMRVLLVDDEEIVRRPLVRFLNGRGASAVEAADGIEALEQLERNEIDVILADLKMPRMDGAELYAEVRIRYPQLARRTVFLTGDLGKLGEAATQDIDPARILLKPATLVEVESHLREAWLSPEDPS